MKIKAISDSKAKIVLEIEEYEELLLELKQTDPEENSLNICFLQFPNNERHKDKIIKVIDFDMIMFFLEDCDPKKKYQRFLLFECLEFKELDVYRIWNED